MANIYSRWQKNVGHLDSLEDLCTHNFPVVFSNASTYTYTYKTLTIYIYSMYVCMHNPSFVVTGKLQAVKTRAPSEVLHFLWRGCFLRRKSWEDDLFRALNTRLDKCNDIQMSTIILCLRGALSNWILIKYWVSETLYLIMKAAPLLPFSGEPAVCSTEWALWIRRACLHYAEKHVYSLGRW